MHDNREIMDMDLDIISEKSVAMDIDMDIISDKPEPTGGNKKCSTSYSYSHTSKRNNSRCKRVQILKKDKACRYWLAGNCKYGREDCKYLHSDVIEGSNVTFLTKLVGHDNKVCLVCFLVSLFALYTFG